MFLGARHHSVLAKSAGGSSYTFIIRKPAEKSSALRTEGGRHARSAGENWSRGLFVRVCRDRFVGMGMGQAKGQEGAATWRKFR